MTDSSSPAAPAGPADITALQRVLAAEHAAVFGYPALGVHLADPSLADRARTLEAAHRDARDALMAQLAARGVTPAAALPDYPMPAGARTPGGAQQWAVALEDGCAEAYRFLLAVSTEAGTPRVPALRAQALTGLTTAARAGTGWRRRIDPAHPTLAFPGL